MKFALLFLCLGAAVSAADFHTGQAARLVIGQETFTRSAPGASAELLGSISGLAYANDRLFVVDSNRIGGLPDNNRVLVYGPLSEILPSPTARFEPEQSRCQVCTGQANTVIGQPDFAQTEYGFQGNKLRQPTAVATDGQVLAIADTNNNRVLIWHSLPQTNGQMADVVVGQEALGSIKPVVTDNRSLRGPQGVWIQNGKLFVADTQNHRVVIWNSIPRQNHQPADLLLGQSDFNRGPEVDLTRAEVAPQPNNLLNPVSVMSDGQRLYVADLGHNRVLIWNSIPTQNQQPADVVIGQPDMTSAIPNNSPALCESNGTNEETGDLLYPFRCARTLDFPRYALSDGTRLFIADGGNDRVLVFNRVPTENGQAADSVLGQPGLEVNLTSDSAEPERIASADSLRTPLSLAWDGSNLYVADTFNRRVMVFTPGDYVLPLTGVRNMASRDVFALGSITFEGTLATDNEVTVKVEDREYKYKAVEDDTFEILIQKLVDEINTKDGGDPKVVATPNFTFFTIVLTARTGGEAGNEVTYSATVSEGAEILITPGGAALGGGQNAAKIAPGTLVTMVGENFTNVTASAPSDAPRLPFELGGVEVYFNGIRAPLAMVSPTQINAQMPFEVIGSTSVNAYVRTERPDGSVTISSPIAVPVILFNPGIFAEEGLDPRPAIVLHGSSFANASIQIEGVPTADNILTVKVEDRSYSYTVKTDDTLVGIRDALINLINENPDEKVIATAANQFTRIRLRAKIPGPEGNGIAIAGETSQDAQVSLSVSRSTLCCASTGGARVTEENPAVPGETIIVYATGLGWAGPDEVRDFIITGKPYEGPEENRPLEFVSSLAGGRTANVLYVGLRRGTVGTWEVHLELNDGLPTNPQTQLWIAQDVQVSNIVSFPVVQPRPPEE